MQDDETLAKTLDATALPPQPAPGRSEATRYRERARLGQGGMGAVLLVDDDSMQREVALKTMHGPAAMDETARKRFLREAQITGRLTHPNIPAIHDLGQDEEGNPYFTMMRVRGEELGDVIKRLAKRDPKTLQEFGLARRLRIFLGVCNAVAFAHAHGVLHRDLKPANVMLGDHGEVLVMDWGLAKVQGAPDLAAAAISDAAVFDGEQTQLTMDGAVLGTPRYMSPEQAEGRPEAVDERSDIFSLGAILYALLAYRHAVEGKTVHLVIANTMQGAWDAPGSRDGDPPVPHELAAVALKALSRRVSARYQSVEELIADVEAYLEGKTLSAARYSATQLLIKWLARHKLAAVGMAAALLALVLGVMLTQALQRKAREDKAQALRLAAHAKGERDPAAAQALCIQSLALVPDHPPTLGLLREISVHLERQRAEEARADQREVLRRELAVQLTESRRLEDAEPFELEPWLRAHTASLRVARELARAGDSEARGEAIQLARVAARRFGAAGHDAMARMMLAEARGLGLDEERAKLDRRLIEGRRRRQERLAEARTHEILHRGAHELHAPGEVTERLLGVEGSSGRVRALLLQAVHNAYHPIHGALGQIGDTQTTVEYHPRQWHASAELAADDRALQALLARRNELLAAIRAAGNQLNAIQALELAMLQQPVDREPAVITEAAGSLARLGAREARVTLHLKRMASGEGSLIWRRTTPAWRRLADPVDLEARLARLPRWLAAAYYRVSDRPREGIALLGEQGAESNSQIELARCQLAAGELGAAERTIAGLLATRAQDPAAPALAAELLRQRGDLPAALQRLAAAVSLSDRPARLLATRARWLLASDAEAAIAAASLAIAHDPECIEAYELRAAAHEAGGALALAITDLTIAQLLDPEESEIHVLRAGLLRRMGHARAAVEDLDRARELAPGVELAVARAEALLELADTHLGQWRDYQALLRIASRDDAPSTVHELLARSTLDAGFINAARSHLASAGDTPRARRLRALAGIRSEKQREARALLDAAIAEAPTPELLMERCLIHNLQGDGQKAQIDLGGAQQAWPHRLEPKLIVGRLHLYAGQRDAAIRSLQQALASPRGLPRLRHLARALLVREAMARAQQRQQAGDAAGCRADLALALRYVRRNPGLRKHLEDQLRTNR